MNANVDSTCPLCASLGAPIDELVRSDRRFTCFACGSCDLQFWAPRHIDPSFYARAGEAHTYERRRNGESFLRDRHRMFLERAAPGRLLDIGCGEGAFLLDAMGRGFDVIGIDLDEGNVAAARARGLHDTHCTMLIADDGRIASPLHGIGKFHWITAFEVLEHQADPLQFLGAIRQLLADGGALCGSVPNRDRILVNRERMQSDGDYPPHHFLWFSAPALERMLRAAGFSRVLVAPIRERNIGSYASYFENTLMGRWTRPIKRSTRSVATRPTANVPTARSGLVSALRLAKNVPFWPVALTARTLAPSRMRSLYFEAA